MDSMDAAFLSGIMDSTVQKLAADFHTETKDLFQSAKTHSEVARMYDQTTVDKTRIVTTRALLGASFRKFLDEEDSIMAELRAIYKVKCDKVAEPHSRSVLIASGPMTDIEIPNSVATISAGESPEIDESTAAEDGSSSHLKRTADLEHHHDAVEDLGYSSEPTISPKKRATLQDPNRYSTAATYAESTDSLSMSPEQLVAQTQYHGARGATRLVTPGTNITQTQVGYQTSSWEVIAGNLGLLHNPRDV
ncbi:uncharacterized protein ARMOST_21745 [Armillaria ostoyae]|uniref:Uncharacterized protein n=1 Tax=Armillaria ostoyae TaxID=47428 RepID=A0A284SB25_ARMOS|nr:uncharacterized protein ARMOST_21745 [Armillaria ostoyae]